MANHKAKDYADARTKDVTKEQEGKYKANFLWGKEGELEVALYEFANCGTEEYREAQYKIIKSLCIKAKLEEE